ncbi:hypothetical protein PAPYR_11023 [Paratrimastix pyriformis]|uniref:Uncharacterized protein n=1 Tax=Paratrimastix pyriformis TaxID=342808 RepID=A0ABQ8U6H3_9EUKA|nr:hypothetical protein PAPYR_11023 [Paratrimastix pyriformis]
MACEITAVNDDLDDATIAFIEKHASILDEEDPFLCFIDELDDHRAIFRSMDQLSRLSFTSTMIPEFGKLFGYLVASEKRIPSTKLLQRISLSILRKPVTVSRYRWRPRSRPTCGFGEPVHCFAAIRPVSKVTEHCQTASRKSDRTLHRPLSCPASAWRWYESATARASYHAEGSLALPHGSGVEGERGGSSTLRDRTGRGGGTLDGGSANNTPRCSCSAPVPDGTWGRGCPTPKKSQCKGIVFLSVQSFVPLFSLFLIYLLDPPYSLVPPPFFLPLPVTIAPP